LKPSNWGKILLLLLAPVSAYPATATWQIMGIGGGGAQFAPVISPHDPNLLFVQCDMGGVYRSTDGGSSFQMLPYGQYSSGTDYPNGACPIAFHPTDSTKAWGWGRQAGDGDWLGFLLTSSDGGITWSKAVPQPDLASIGAARVTRIVLDRANPSFMILGTDYGAFRSIDGGASWTQATGVTGYVWGIVIDQSSSMASRTCVIGSYDGVFRSTNEAASFTASNTGIPAPVNLTGFSGGSTGVTCMLYAVQEATLSVYRSLDRGQNWSLAHASGGAELERVECAETDPTVAYVMNNTDGDQIILKSSDSGVNWADVFNPALAGGNVTLGWIDRDLSFPWGSPFIQIGVDPVDPNRVLASDLGCTYQTTDGGTTWAQIYSNFADVAPPAAGKLWTTRGLEVTTSYHYYIHPGNPLIHFIPQADTGLQRSTDGGATWRHNQPAVSAWRNSCYDMAFVPGTPWHLFAAKSSHHDIPHSAQLAATASGSGGVEVSVDDGATWASASTGLPSLPALSLAYDASHTALYVAMWGSGVWKSVNNGGSWAMAGTGLGNGTNLFATQVRVAPNGDVYGLVSGQRNFTNAGGLFKLTNGGTTWTCLTTTADSGQPLYYPQGFAFHPSTPATIFVASARWGSPDQLGLYRTRDGGTNWTKLTMPASPLEVTGYNVSIDPVAPNHVFFATETHGLLESFDGGDNWAAVAGLPFRTVQDVLFDNANLAIYVSTFGGGVWKHDLTGGPAATSTWSPTRTSTPLFSPTPTSTRTPTFMVSTTATPTSSPTLTTTPSATPSFTSTRTATSTPSSTATYTVTRSLTPTATITPTPTATLTATPTSTRTASFTSTFTRTSTVTWTPTWSPTPTFTRTFTLTPTATGTPTPTFTPTVTPTGTITPFFTATWTPASSTGGNPILYPNPVQEGDEVWVTLPHGKTGDQVKVAIITTASRVVSHQVVSVAGDPAVLKVILNDDKGIPLANGIYFMTLEPRSGPKALKLIILH